MSALSDRKTLGWGGGIYLFVHSTKYFSTKYLFTIQMPGSVPSYADFKLKAALMELSVYWVCMRVRNSNQILMSVQLQTEIRSKERKHRSGNICNKGTRLRLRVNEEGGSRKTYLKKKFWNW